MIINRFSFIHVSSYSVFSGHINIIRHKNLKPSHKSNLNKMIRVISQKCDLPLLFQCELTHSSADLNLLVLRSSAPIRLSVKPSTAAFCKSDSGSVSVRTPHPPKLPLRVSHFLQRSLHLVLCKCKTLLIT